MGEHLQAQIFHPWLVEPLDRVDLARRLVRFRDHHRQRYIDAQERLPNTARMILTALPCLLHYNHPYLPGYTDTHSPQGISTFTPDPDELRALKQVAPGYTGVTRNSSLPNIDAIFFMGSAGSVAHTKHSDLDIWVCLPSAQHAAIQNKLSKISQWAEQLGVELQCFAVDPKQFTGGMDLATSPLLLDEFYRTACLIAGRYPLWWLMPDNAGANYPAIASRLLEGKFVQRAQVIDFGEVSEFDGTEIFAAGVRELERSFRTPHKSLMKLALLESYTSGATALSQRYKQMVIEGVPTEALDVYMVLAGHLDTFFAHPPELKQRQHFLRRAWLIKTGRGNVRLQKHPMWWQLAKKWGYQGAELEHLRWPSHWPLTEIIEEHHRTTAAFAHALSFLKDLEQNLSDQTSSPDLVHLHHRLNDARALILQNTQYNDKLLHAIVPRDHHGQAYIERSAEGTWQLLEQTRCIITRPTLAQIFLWLKRQGLGMQSLHTQAAQVEGYRQISQALENEPYVALLNAENMIAANIEAEQQVDYADDLNLDDPLCYGDKQICLIQHVDLVHTPKNGRNDARFWTDFSAALCAMLELPNVTTVAVGGVRRQRITSRVNQLISEAQAQLQIPNTNYVFALGTDVCCLSNNAEAHVSAHHFTDVQDYFLRGPAGRTFLTRYGALVQSPQYHESLEQVCLTLLANKPRLTLCYRDHATVETLYPPPRLQANFIQSLSLFIAMAKQRGLAVPTFYDWAGDSAPAPIVCSNIDSHLRFRLVFNYNPRGWTVQCGQQIWHDRKLDFRLLSLVRNQIKAHRSNQTNYPIYLTDMSFGQADFVTTLRCKYLIEQALNTQDPREAAGTLNIIGDPR